MIDSRDVDILAEQLVFAVMRAACLTDNERDDASEIGLQRAETAAVAAIARELEEMIRRPVAAYLDAPGGRPSLPSNVVDLFEGASRLAAKRVLVQS